jgi:hypothetical protein
MSSRLFYFLIKMAEDLDLQRAYAADPDKVMAKFGLSSSERNLVTSGDTTAVNRAVSGGDDFVILKVLQAHPNPKPKPKPKK